MATKPKKETPEPEPKDPEPTPAVDPFRPKGEAVDATQARINLAKLLHPNAPTHG